MRGPLALRLVPKICLFQCLQYEWARKFPDYEQISAKILSIDLIINNSHDPSMYTLSMDVFVQVFSLLCVLLKKCG